MAELESVLAELRRHEGVEHVLLVGQDGLLVHDSGTREVDGETMAALAPGLASAVAGFGEAAALSGFSTAVFEWSDGVGVLAPVSEELLLVVLLAPGVGFAPLLHSLREQRPHFATML